MDLLEQNFLEIMLTLLFVIVAIFCLTYLNNKRSRKVNKSSVSLNESSKKNNLKDKSVSLTDDVEVKSMSKPGKPIQWLEVKNKVVEEAQKKIEIKSLKDLNKFNAEVSVIKNIAKLNEQETLTNQQKEEDMYSQSALANILVVDDALVVRKKISDLLKAVGYSVITKNDGWEAYSFLTEIADNKRRSPDIIITDIEMPNMNGLQLIDAIKKIEFIKNTPIIVVSSHVELHMTLIQGGNINGFISKPFKDEDLLNQVEYLLN